MLPGATPILGQMHLTDLTVAPAAHKCTFVLHGASDAVANALRRTMLCDVPTVRISSVSFVTNTTIFPDDMIAHRLGLMPPLGAVDPVNGCVAFSIDRQGPCNLLSDDVHCSDPSVRLRPGLLLCRLEEGQCLELTATCTVGDGRKHARFQACVAPRYAKTHRRSNQSSECWCEATAFGRDCRACGRHKPSLAACGGPVVHRFGFETDSSAAPLWLLAQTLVVLERRVAQLLAAVTAPPPGLAPLAPSDLASP